nr:MAG TPA: periplasmic lypoprotein [Caudoviricetes sp.]
MSALQEAFIYRSTKKCFSSGINRWYDMDGFE